jgi:hypothetical protein
MYVRFNQIEFLQMESSANVDFLKSNSEKIQKTIIHFIVSGISKELQRWTVILLNGVNNTL